MIIGAVYENGYVKNKVMEFMGPGVASMTTDYHNTVDVMTTETTCLSSIWITDENLDLVAPGRQAELAERFAALLGPEAPVFPISARIKYFLQFFYAKAFLEFN